MSFRKNFILPVLPLILVIIFSANSFAAWKAVIEVFFSVNNIVINGVSEMPQQRPFVHNNTAYVPLRYIAENLGCRVRWDEKARTIYIDRDPLAPAREGKLDGIEFGIGSDIKDVLEKWGEPEHSDSFNAGPYYSYDDITFFTDIQGNITSIAWSGSRLTYGVRAGMSFSRVKEILGAPDDEGLSDEEDEIGGGGWYMRYNAGRYIVIFYGKDKDSPVDFAVLLSSK